MQIYDISKFIPGTKVRRGDPADCWNGVVVFNNSMDLYSDAFPKQHWEYLGPGFMVKYQEVGLVYVKEVDDEETIS